MKIEAQGSVLTGNCNDKKKRSFGCARGVGFKPQPLGYEDSGLNDSVKFQGLNAARNDRKSLERPQSIAIGP